MDDVQQVNLNGLIDVPNQSVSTEFCCLFMNFCNTLYYLDFHVLRLSLPSSCDLEGCKGLVVFLCPLI